jgi:hypothetical protein
MADWWLTGRAEESEVMESSLEDLRGQPRLGALAAVEAVGTRPHAAVVAGDPVRDFARAGRPSSA